MYEAAKIGFYNESLDSYGLTAITDTGEVWKSWTQGQSWTQITNAMATTPLSSIIPNPLFVATGTGTNNIFVIGADTWTNTTGSYGPNGAYSVDGGVNWTSMGAAPQAPNAGVSGPATGLITTAGYAAAFGTSTIGTIGFTNMWAIDANGNWATASYMTTTNNAWKVPGGSPSGGFISGPSYGSYTQVWNFSGSPPFYSSPGVPNSGSVFYHPTSDSLYSFDSSNTLWTRSSSSAGSGWNNTNTSVANAQNVTETSYAIRGGGGSGIGSFAVLGLGATSTNTFYVSRDPATWTLYSAGVSASGLAHRAVWARNGALIWRRGATAGKTTNEAWWTTDACATLTARNMPATRRWVGVVWQP